MQEHEQQDEMPIVNNKPSSSNPIDAIVETTQVETSNMVDTATSNQNSVPSLDSPSSESTTINPIVEDMHTKTGDELHTPTPMADTSDSIPSHGMGKAMHTPEHEQTIQPDSMLGGGEQPQPKQAKPRKQRNRNALLLGGCILLSGATGFGGALLAINMNGGSASPKVILQSVQQTDTNGSSITNMSVKDVVKNTQDTVVEIQTEQTTNDSFMQQYVSQGAGSGVIITDDGYIVTNNHVIEGASKITVRTKDGNSYSATLIGRDEKTDLAVIKIDATDLTPAIFGDSDSLAVGDQAIAIGNPLGELGGTVTTGIISALDREITIDNQTMHLLQTDTAINPGNSGGGLFNAAGELIGVVNAKSSGSSIEGLGFAIPGNTAKVIIQNIIENGYVKGRPQLGVSLISLDTDTKLFQYGVEDKGVYIAKVSDNSSASAAGLKVKDLILAVDGEEITTSTEIINAVDAKKAGDTMELTIKRDGKTQSITVTLKEAEQTTNDSSSNNDSKSNNPWSAYQ